MLHYEVAAEVGPDLARSAARKVAQLDTVAWELVGSAAPCVGPIVDLGYYLEVGVGPVDIAVGEALEMGWYYGGQRHREKYPACRGCCIHERPRSHGE